MRRYHQLSISYPKRVLAAGMLAMMAGTTFIALFPRIEMNPTFKSMIMPDDRDRDFDAEAKKVFGDDEFVIMAVENDAGVFNTETLELIDRLSTKVKRLEGVREVYSLTESDNIRAGEGNNFLDTDPLIDEVPQSEDGVRRVEVEAFENPTFPGVIVSRDKKAAAVVVEIKLSHAETAVRGAITEKIRALADEEDAKAEFADLHVTGFPVLSHESATLMLHDMVVFSGVATMILMIVIWIIFRNVQAVVFTMLVANIGLATAYGSMAALGVPVVMPSSSIMVFLTALGMQYSIYVGYAYIVEMLRQREAGEDVSDHRPVLSEAVRKVRPAVLLSVVTTCIGFLSMLANPVKDLSDMGLFLAIGTAAAGLASITIVPALIALWPFEVRARGQHNRATNWLIGKIGTSTRKRAKIHLLVAGIVAVAAASSWTRLETDVDPMNYFRTGSEIRKDEKFVRDHMGGTAYLRAVVVGKELDAFKKPENLRKLGELTEYAESLPNVAKAVSQEDSVSLINRALLQGEEDEYRVPDTKRKVENWLTLHDDPTDFRLAIDHDYRWASIGLRIDTMSSKRLLAIEKEMESVMAEKFPDFQVNVAGTLVLVQRAVNKMASSMLVSLGIALVAIFVVILTVFRSFKLAALAIVPNAIPIMLNYAIIAVLGIPLDPPIAITGAIALGIAIDDTVHFFKAWLAYRDTGLSSEEAVQRALQDVGRPMILSTVVLAVGFSVLVLSAYGVLVWTGIMLCITSVNTLLSDLLVTPAMLSLVDSGRRKSEKA